jgi:ATP-dependent helicase/nuclease subunit A
MTRAADRLIVCGATGERGNPLGCWYDLVHGALADTAVEEPADHGDGTVWRHRGGPLTEGSGATSSEQRPLADRPVWLDQDAPRELLAARELTPSHADQDSRPARAQSGIERLKALARGEAIHRLLQALPAIASAERETAAVRYLTRFADTFDDAERASMIEHVRRVLADARFADLFGPLSRAEVPIVGRLCGPNGAIRVSGQVDRLAVSRDGVLIADYKTNRPAPQHLEDVPAAYLTQLALYRAVLARLYPDRPIRAALLWTDVPDLMEIPSERLDRVLATLTST